MNLNNFILFLKSIKGIGDGTIRNLINHKCFSNIDIQSISDCKNWLLNNRNLFSKKIDISYITDEVIKDAFAKTNSYLEYLNKIGSSFITFFDKNYPKSFKNMIKTNDYPICLFYKGNINLLNSTKICAIIGTREPSKQAKEYGSLLSKKYVENGYVIVSGLAKGCDTIGHSSCIDSKGKTIAIMATGIDIIYPKENVDLAKKIVETGGLLITEELPKFKGASYSFVSRDRLQTALSNIVIALETSSTGGTMHAAKACSKYYKDLYVLDPVLIPDSDYSGNIELINYFGAKKITKI